VDSAQSARESVEIARKAYDREDEPEVLEPAVTAGRVSGHDFTAMFLFETTALAYLGVIVDDDMRSGIIGRVTDRLHHGDLDRLLDRPRRARPSPTTSPSGTCGRPDLMESVRDLVPAAAAGLAPAWRQLAAGHGRDLK
jgi:hypothetical protein